MCELYPPMSYFNKTLHEGTTEVQVEPNYAIFEEHTFAPGSITKITFPKFGSLWLSKCIIDKDAVIEVDGGSLYVNEGEPHGIFRGTLRYVTSYVPISMKQLTCELVQAHGDWSEDELDAIGDHHRVLFHSTNPKSKARLKDRSEKNSRFVVASSYDL